MTTSEEILASTTLKDVLPILSLETKRTLAQELRDAVQKLGPRAKTLRNVAVAVEADYRKECQRLEKIEAELTIG